MAKDIFDTIIEKEFDQLSYQDLTEISEFCTNEQEFIAMKQVLLHSKAVADGPKLAPKEATKEKLDNLFDATYGKSRKFIPFYLNPLIQIAAVVAIGFAVWMFIPSTESISSEQLAENTPSQKEEKATNESQVASQPSEDKSLKAQQNTVSAPPPAVLGEISENGMVPEKTVAYKRMVEENRDNIEALINFPSENAKKSSEEVASMFKDSEVEAKTKVSTATTSRSTQTFSSPSTSISDISINPDKKPAQQTVATMNVAEQKNVLNYLATKY